MILAVPGRYTHHCPPPRLNAVRWCVGSIAALLWAAVGFGHLPHDRMLWNLLAALVATQAFGITSSGLLMLRPRHGMVERLTDWYGIVCSVMTWVIGVAAFICNDITWLQALLLVIAVLTGILWLGLIYFGLRPIHLGAIERE